MRGSAYVQDKLRAYRRRLVALPKSEPKPKYKPKPKSKPEAKSKPNLAPKPTYYVISAGPHGTVGGT